MGILHVAQPSVQEVRGVGAQPGEHIPKREGPEESHASQQLEGTKATRGFYLCSCTAFMSLM